jgi:hypothetical protein
LLLPAVRKVSADVQANAGGVIEKPGNQLLADLARELHGWPPSDHWWPQ